MFFVVTVLGLVKKCFLLLNDITHHLPSLTSLNLLTVAYADRPTTHSTLHLLLFIYLYICPSFKNSLGDALMLAGARLTVLDLSDNAFGPDGVKGIERLLKSTACYTLQELRLNNCGMGIGGGKVSHKNVYFG